VRHIIDFIFGAGMSYDAQDGAFALIFLLAADYAAAIVCCTITVFIPNKRHTQFFRITALCNYSAFTLAFILWLILSRLMEPQHPQPVAGQKPK
jgi:predicted small integral membrane protein